MKEAQPFISERAKEAKRRAQRHLGFEALMTLADNNVIDRDAAISLVTENPTIIGQYYPASFRSIVMAKLESSVEA